MENNKIMDWIMTYGWVFLILFVVAVALFAMGVFR